MRPASIKVGFCVAYDFEMLRHSLPLVLPHADVICLSLDKDRISWSGHPFSWDQVAFERMLNEVDPEGRIVLYEDDFHLPDLRPMDNEVRQRNRMAAHMGNGGWHVQLDADEYFLDFEGFTNYLRALKVDQPTNIYCPWVVLYKQVDGGFLWVPAANGDEQDFVTVATNAPRYEHGRRNGDRNHWTKFLVIHQSWARPDAEIAEKLANWGHSDDLDTAAYLQRWRGLDATNYTAYRDFHPTKPPHWRSLDLAPGKTVEDVILHFKQDPPVHLSKSFLLRKNSLWYARLQKGLRLLGMIRK